MIDNLSFKVPAGAIVGIIGPNGAGKSTIFRMIQGAERPDAGEVVIGSTVKMAFVDQSRESLANDKTVWEDVSGGLDNLTVGKFVMPSRAYLGRFNFKGNDQQKRIGNLSGGERGRLHLAKTLSQGGNVLLLDEPSNDLDVETLRALEDALLEFAGSVMVISHDRWFLDRIATHILACRRRVAMGLLRRQLPGIRGRQAQAARRGGRATAPLALQAAQVGRKDGPDRGRLCTRQRPDCVRLDLLHRFSSPDDRLPEGDYLRVYEPVPRSCLMTTAARPVTQAASVIAAAAATTRAGGAIGPWPCNSVRRREAPSQKTAPAATTSTDASTMIGASWLTQPDRSANSALTKTATPVRVHDNAVRSACKPASGTCIAVPAVAERFQPSAINNAITAATPSADAASSGMAIVPGSLLACRIAISLARHRR